MSINKIFLSSLASLFLCCACSNNWFTHYNGNMPASSMVEKLEIGLSKEEVTDLLGVPSNVISLDKNTWLYMSSKTEQIAFIRPTELERDILLVRFDQYEQVEEIQKIALVDGKQIEINKDKTPSLGKNPGFFEKYFSGAQYNPMSSMPQ